jgi:hypothetical protein
VVGYADLKMHAFPFAKKWLCRSVSVNKHWGFGEVSVLVRFQ